MYRFMGTALLTAVQTMSAHVLAPYLAEEKGLITGYTFPFKTGEYGIIQHVRESSPVSPGAF